MYIVGKEREDKKEEEKDESRKEEREEEGRDCRNTRCLLEDGKLDEQDTPSK